MTYAGFRTRNQLKLRAPKNRSRNVSPEDGGVAVHWGGPGNAPNDHVKCEDRWRAWQNFHMDDRGWADIAYNFGFCNHGYVLAGRGYGVRSAAQGTNDGNDRFMAACFVGGEDGPAANEHAIDALKWIVVECRRLGADWEVRPHHYFHSTGCPGGKLTIEANKFHNKPVANPALPGPKPPIVKPSPLPEVSDMELTDKVPVRGAIADYLTDRGVVLSDTNGKPVAKGADGFLKVEQFIPIWLVEQMKTRELLQQMNLTLAAIAEDVDDDVDPLAGP